MSESLSGAWYSRSLDRIGFGRLPVVVVMSGLAAWLLIKHVSRNGLFSENWVMIAVGVMLLEGSLCAIVQSCQGLPTNRASTRASLILVMLMLVLLLCSLLTSPDTIARTAQRLESPFHLGTAIFAMLVFGVSAAYFLTKPGTRIVAKVSLRSWTVAMVFAVVALQVHFLFDATYNSDKVVGHGRTHEIQARLEGDWKERYTKNAANYFSHTP